MDVNTTGLNSITELITVVLAVSLATERLVTIVRTPKIIGQFFNQEQQPEIDGPRRLRVQVLSFLCAWVTCALLAAGGWDPSGQIVIAKQSYAVWFVAFLAMGGSSFWKNLLGYTKAVRDIRRKDLAKSN